MQVSKGYIEAMSGVLNGEKWTRPRFSHMDNGHIRMDAVGYVVETYDGYTYSCVNYNPTKHDMTATDWTKVE